MNNDALRFPIGKFIPQDFYSEQEIALHISHIESLPQKIETILTGFTDKQFNTTYRDGGWTIKQVIHHMADSHLNAYIRFKWTLTEETPTIKAYSEKAWAETLDNEAEPTISLHLLKALHVKWTELLKRLTAADLQKEFIHPESKKRISLARLIALYAWHSEHHLGHIQIVASKN